MAPAFAPAISAPPVAFESPNGVSVQAERAGRQFAEGQLTEWHTQGRYRRALAVEPASVADGGLSVEYVRPRPRYSR